MKKLVGTVTAELEKLNLISEIDQAFEKAKGQANTRKTAYVKEESAVALLEFLIARSDKYLFDPKKTILNPSDITNPIELLHKINDGCECKGDESVSCVTGNLNNFCELYVNKERWKTFKADFYKWRHYSRTKAQGTTLSAEALGKLRQAQAKLKLESLSATVLELINQAKVLD